MEKLKLYKKQLIVVGSIACLLVIIILVMTIDTSAPVIPDKSVEETPTIPNDTIIIENIIQSIDESEIEVISNQNNEQADLILDSIGVDIKNIFSYAASIDPKVESTHAIVVIKPKEEEKVASKRALLEYVSSKQHYFLDSGLAESEAYETAKSAIVLEKEDYLILVLENNPRQILDTILGSLESEGLIEPSGPITGGEIEILEGEDEQTTQEQPQTVQPQDNTEQESEAQSE